MPNPGSDVGRVGTENDGNASVGIASDGFASVGIASVGIASVGVASGANDSGANGSVGAPSGGGNGSGGIGSVSRGGRAGVEKVGARSGGMLEIPVLTLGGKGRTGPPSGDGTEPMILPPRIDGVTRGLATTVMTTHAMMDSKVTGSIVEPKSNESILRAIKECLMLVAGKSSQPIPHICSQRLVYRFIVHATFQHWIIFRAFLALKLACQCFMFQSDIFPSPDDQRYGVLQINQRYIWYQNSKVTFGEMHLSFLKSLASLSSFCCFPLQKIVFIL